MSLIVFTDRIDLLDRVPWESCDATLGFLPTRSLLLFRESDGVDALDEKQGISLLALDDSLPLLDLLYLRSVLRQRLKRSPR